LERSGGPHAIPRLPGQGRSGNQEAGCPAYMEDKEKGSRAGRLRH
jgi:hypothetical protein